ncbi:TPA: hypothetical protein HA351_01365 [Methanosarcinaceae archaeon]|nr:hypothetical protein [Methanosarcinaceae archaeon]
MKATKTEISTCKICNLLNSKLLAREETNLWIGHSFTGKYDKPMSIESLTDRVNEKILEAHYIESAPGEELTFDVEAFRRYIQARYIDPGRELDPKTWEIGNAIFRKSKLDIYMISRVFINENDMRKHLKECLGIEPEEFDQNSRTEKDINASLKFASTILERAVGRAVRRGIIEDLFSIEINVRCKECGKVYPFSDLLKVGKSCPCKEGTKRSGN